ncbi:MAG: phosphate acyltransferase PlsX [Chloroflexia bacterium]|nr:phosphate acyltransferase PlsX [Chloroflexia bacterium]
MRIAVDAAGGDHGPAVIVAGAVDGARRFGVDLLLTGAEAEIRRALFAHDTAGIDIVVEDAPETIGGDEQPAQAVRRKPRSAIAMALDAVRDGRAAALVSAGNSGAVMAGALLKLGRIRGVDRPAIAGYLPSMTGKTLVLDMGAVTDPRPSHLVQFAQMGSIYIERAFGVERPTVGLLSNGEEPSKGNQLVQETFPLLSIAPGIDFRGNVEGNDITRGIVDVIVTDGFTGNVLLKTAEGAASLINATVRRRLTANPFRTALAAMLRPAFDEARKDLDYAEQGGAPLLGIDGVVIISHGRSNARAIANAIGVAKRSVDGEVPDTIARLMATLEPAREPAAATG